MGSLLWRRFGISPLHYSPTLSGQVQVLVTHLGLLPGPALARKGCDRWPDMAVASPLAAQRPGGRPGVNFNSVKFVRFFWVVRSKICLSFWPLHGVQLLIHRKVNNARLICVVCVCEHGGTAGPNRPRGGTAPLVAQRHSTFLSHIFFRGPDNRVATETL